MPSTLNQNSYHKTEIMRRIEQGPAPGGTEVTKDLMDLERKQKYQAEIVNPFQKQQQLKQQ